MQTIHSWVNFFQNKIFFFLSLESTEILTFSSLPSTMGLHLLAADVLAFCYIFLKIYRILCFVKLTFDQLPLFNPYYWPLSAVRILTTPYFRFCSNFLPPLRFGQYSYNASVLLSLELLLASIRIVARFRFLILNQAQNLVM